MNNEKLIIKKIKKIFKNIEPPDDILRISYWQCVSESEKNKLIGIKWEDLSLEIIENNDLFMSCLPDDYFCYYLPSFLIAAINDNYHGGGNVFSRVFNGLLPYPYGLIGSNFLVKRIKYLNKEQKNLIYDIIYVIKDDFFVNERKEAMNELLKFYKNDEDS
jgi:hypothetical protein